MKKQEPAKARVNITVDVANNGAKKKVELPLNLLIIDDFNPGTPKKPLAMQEKLLVTKHTLSQAMKEMAPMVQLIVDNKVDKKAEELCVNLTFNSIADFRPENIVNQVPLLKRMLAMRALLKELRSNVSSNVEFRKMLEKIVKDPHQRAQLQGQLPEQMETVKEEAK